MPRRLHLVAGLLAPLSIAVFLLSTVVVELFGSPAAVAQLKSLIVTPGLWIVIPAIAAAGGSGMSLSKSRKGRLTQSKKKRMPFIAANGLLVLLPCAIVLDRWASAHRLDGAFYALQAIELIFGAVNLALMGINVRDGLRMAGRLGRSQPAVPDGV
ncbi:MAG: hypothetical protein GX886_05405 [Comamonadaceae bacterium]|jgi:hypothetical protein|nr:hypothetical protein [Rubrivivax sp.]NLZ40688.1 hypothetical protein [Comamonadaceae bacterium]